MTTLAQYEDARAALAHATRIDHVLPILDEIAHVKLYAKQIEDRELMREALEFQMDAERRLGFIIIEAKKAGYFAEGRPKKNGNTGEPFTGATLEEAGVSKRLSAKSQKTASISERAYQGMKDRMRERMASQSAILVDPVAEAVKLERDAKRKADHAALTYAGGKIEDLHALAASGFKAGAILADPAWQFIARSDKGEGRSASQHYDVQGLEAIKALPIKELAADDCVLFMWMLDWCPNWAFEVIKAWGFEHKTTAFTWMKLTANHDGLPRCSGLISDRDFHFGQGYWTRANPEDCWLATRGSPKRINADVRQLIIHPVMEHSRKPDDIHGRIERLVDGPYLELNARREVENWLTWGNEVEFKMPPSTFADDGSPTDQETGEILTGEVAA